MFSSLLGGNADHKPTSGRLLWTHRKSRRQDLRAPLPLHWSERAKPLEDRVAAASVGCCVLCCVVCCGLSKFSHHTGSKTILAKSKWLTFARSYHKIGPQTPHI
jgi:hypothetical protein